MIDIHCHIIPGVDDGPGSLAESIEMAERATAEGIRTIIGTPHHMNGQYNNLKEDIIKKASLLNNELRKRSIPLKVLPGQETRIHEEMIEGYRKGELQALDPKGKYMFIELPSDHMPRYTEALLYDIQMLGLMPIIVHPERNLEFQQRPNMLYKLVKKGALTQITAGSLLGHFGKKSKKLAHMLIELNLTHYVATDAHNVTSRSFHLSEAYDEIKRKYGVEKHYMFMENAELLLESKLAYKEMPHKVEPKRLLGIF
ncbi:tyrosine-protein phosphatase [Bacillus massiliglaciei]|uniref:tyrosine-protein phosphatase n=1 Tax=Bacillus massiliglaciei TaxID=1816693 RepID=UPI000B114B18|nr:CpsB/CapC family capsule biosynthesis tyrosine phosphatase [Bacillus massiliglaciei]